jgi:hypothetical protein
MKKIFLISVLLALLAAPVFSAIGAASLSVDARRGWSWFFTNNHTQAFAVWEAQLVVHLEAQGLEYNKQRLESNAARRAKIDSIREALRGATDEQINAALAALGLN